MLVSADWVLPVSGPAIRDGAVLVNGPHVVGVGPARELAETHAASPIHEFPGCVLTPGFVNAHTHLSLTAMSGLIPEQPFHPWVRQLVRAIGAMQPDDFAASASWGALESLSCGTTTVGDIAYGPEALASAADLGLAGVFFWEVLGLSSSELAETLLDREFPTSADHLSARGLAGISPHSVYTSGPGLIRATHALARAAEVPFAIHAAESEAEHMLMAGAGGPLEQISSRKAHGFRPPHVGTIEYLERLGVLDGAVLAHCVHLRRRDAERIAAKAKAAVLCPRSNRYLRNGRPPVADLMASGALLALGTDSAASNESLDMLDEARALREVHPALGASRLLRMITLDGARALGMERYAGSLEEGKYADLVLTRVRPTQEPFEALLEEGGRSQVEAVMTTGLWRVREGTHSFPVEKYRQAFARVAEKAAVALQPS